MRQGRLSPHEPTKSEADPLIIIVMYTWSIQHQHASRRFLWLFVLLIAAALTISAVHGLAEEKNEERSVSNQ